MKVSRSIFVAALVITISFSLLTQNVYSQKAPPETYKLKGAVADLSTGKPLTGVTVLVLSRKDGHEFTGTTTDEKGFFTVENIPESSVKAKFSMVGYQTQIVDSVSLEMSSVMGLVKLRQTAIVMPEVVIKSLKPMVEYHIDKKIINMDMVPGSNGSVTDALRNSGALDVDPSTNKITVRGQEVKLKMDGHDYTMPMETLTQMPASMIDQVEVVLAPGAKESAEGGAYVLNLISKKNTLDNYNGSVSLSTATNNRNYGSLNLNYKVNKVNFFGSFFGGLGEGRFIDESERFNFFSQNLHHQLTQGKSTYKGYGASGKLGFDYTLNDNNLFTFYGAYNKFSNTNDSKSETKIFNNGSPEVQQYTYNNNNNSEYISENLSFYGFYKKKFDMKGHELILDAMFNKQEFPSTTELNTQYSYRTQYPHRQNSENGVKSNNFIVKSDYSMPFSTGKFEAGYSFTTRFRENDYNVRDFSYLQNAWSDSMHLSNRFRYTEDIHALYSTYFQKLGKFEVKAGLRWERLATHGEQFTTNHDFRETYNNLFPELNLAYKLSDMMQLTFNTFRRVRYPQLWYVNPFRVYNGPNSFEEGNPKLKPFFLNSYSVSLSQFLNFYYVYSTGMFTGVSTNVQDSVIQSSYINLGNNKTYGIEVTIPYYNSPSMPFHLPGFITMMNIRFEYMWRRQEGAYLTEDLTYTVKRPSLNVNLGLKLWYDINASAYLRYAPQMESKRDKTSEMKYLSLTLSKSLLDQKLRVNLSVNDLLNSQIYDNETFGSNFHSKSHFRVENSRGITLSLSYMFNDFKERRDRNLDDGRDSSGKSNF